MKTTFIKTILTLTFSLIATLAFAQSTITGTVVDEDGNPVPGANIVVQGTTEGVAADFDGNFTITTNQPVPFDIEVSSVGFGSKVVNVTSSDQSLEITLASGTKLDEMVVTASRRPERVQDSPASVSVLSTDEIRNSPYVQDPTAALQNIPGVKIQQQSANSINIEMRAGDGVFGTSTFVMLDYRYIVTPSAGSFFSYQTGLSNLDIEQVEVVRGPAGALYGPNVTSGVVHFLSKSPIDHPGTTAETWAGTQSNFGGAFRHAEANSDGTFGWKVNVRYNRGDEFGLDPLQDADQISDLAVEIREPILSPQGVVDEEASFRAPDNIIMDEGDLDLDNDGNPLLSEYEQYSANLHMEFRPSDDTTGKLAAGMANGYGLFFNSQGPGVTQGYDYWVQANIRKGRWFANAYYNFNDGGGQATPTFLYLTGLRQQAIRNSFETQIQYNFEIDALNTEFTAGFDYRNNASESNGTLYGRNDGNDDYANAGGYLQGTTKLSDKLSMIFTGRYDKINFIDEGKFAPRIAFTYKASPRHTFRASYSEATFAPSALQTYIDFPVQRVVPGTATTWLAGQINPTNFASAANPVQGSTSQLIELIGTYGLGPGGKAIKVPVGTPGVPNSIIWGAAYQPASGAPGIRDGALAQLAGTGLESVFTGVMDAYTANGGPSTSFSGNLVGLNFFNGSPLAQGTNAQRARIGYIETMEFGYKGLIADKFRVGVDFYTYGRVGLTQFTALAPSFSALNFDPNAFADQVVSEITASMTAATAAAYNGLGIPDTGLPPGLVPSFPNGVPSLADATAQLIGGVRSGAVGAAVGYAGLVGGVQAPDGTFTLPLVGAIESDRVPDDELLNLSAGYRDYADAKRSHWGSDVSIDYLATDNLTIWGNYSYVSQNVWNVGDDGLLFPQNLNTPLNKYNLGLRLTGANGFRTSLTYQHADSFLSDQGMYGGDTDERNLVDFSIGRQVGNIQLDLAATNLFNQKYRAFPGMPIIERRVTLRAGFKF
tara:strand:- start:506 stop:3496 length:2991 start_codon:yes stop_codon:yes gene_type:complete